jgi:tetratricopeptide (TPR) repeat protein
VFPSSCAATFSTRIATTLIPVVVLLILMLAEFPDAQVRPRDTDFARGYRALVDAYRAGDSATAVSGVLALKQTSVDALVNQYVKLAERGFHSDPALDQSFFRAAALLHAEAAFRCWDELRFMECGAHLELGRLLVDVSERDKEAAGSFRRRWYAATALVASRHLVTKDALEYFENAVRTFPDDVPLLTAAAWFAERVSNRAAAREMSLGNAQALRRRYQQTAERFLQSALDVDPRAAEASLRLARVQASMGQREQARARLAALLARDDIQPSIAYLARVMLGDIRELDGDAAEAERLYRDAIALDSIAQSARIALAHLLYSAGDSAGAADSIEPLVTRTAKPESNDPWSEYQLAYPSAGQVLLEQLRAEVQR